MTRLTIAELCHRVAEFTTLNQMIRFSV